MRPGMVAAIQGALQAHIRLETSQAHIRLETCQAQGWSGEYIGVEIMFISQLRHLLFITIYKSLIVFEEDIDALILLDLEIFMKLDNSDGSKVTKH